MKNFYKSATAVVLSLSTTLALAAGPSAGDLSDLTPDVSTILTLIGAIGAVVIGVVLAKRGLFTAKSVTNKI